MGIKSYKKFLISNMDYTISQAEEFASAVSTISNLMIEEKITSSTLYGLSIDAFKAAHQKICVRKSYVELNVTFNNLYSLALNCYEKYLEDRERKTKPSYYLEDCLYEALYNENKGNQYGVTLSVLANDVSSDESIVKEILDEANWAREQYHRYFFVDLYSDNNLELDFSSLSSFAYTQPLSINYFGEEVVVYTWKDLYSRFLQFYQEDYPNILSKLASTNENELELSFSLDNHTRHYLEEITLETGIIADLDGSASVIVSQIRALLYRARVDYENVKIIYNRLPVECQRKESEKPSDDLNKTIEYLISRKYVVSSKPILNTVSGNTSYNVIRNSVKDIMFLYDIDNQGEKSIVLKFNKEYISRRLYFLGFDKVVVNKNEDSISLYFTSYDDIEKSLKLICDLIDDFFFGNTQNEVKYEPYSNDTGISIKEAIVIVLSESEDLLTAKEIYNRIVYEDLYHFGAKNPVDVVTVELKRSCDSFDNWANTYKEKLFTFDGVSKYGLLSKKVGVSLDKPAEFNDVELEWVKNNLNDDVVELSEFKNKFINHFLDCDEDKINIRNFKKLGYRVSDNVLYKSTDDPDKFFKKYFLKNDILDLSDKEWLLKNHSAYMVLRNMRKQYQLIEFAKLKYITSKKMNRHGLFEDDINEFCNAAFEFAHGKCFTVYNLKKSGFKSALFDLGFDDIFYNSIFMYYPECSYQKICGEYLFRAGAKKASLLDVVKDYVFEAESVDIYYLIDWIKNEYGIEIEKHRLLNIVKDSVLFYSDIMEKLYKDYNKFFMEV